MTKTVNRAILAAAAASLALLPIAAQANIRAGDSGSVYSVAAQGTGSVVDGDEEGGFIDGSTVVIGLVGAALVVGGIVSASESDDEGQSPGT